jgi:hypothetical protein
MGCSHHEFWTTIVSSPPMLRHGEFELPAVNAKAGRTKIKPHGIRDSVHVDPEHVWGDEGPVNE